MCASTTQTRKDARTALLGADVVFCLDYNAPSRAGELGPAVATAASQADPFVVVIDHHQQPEDFADLLLSDPSTGSTAELIYRLALAWGMADDIHATWLLAFIADSSRTQGVSGFLQSPRTAMAAHLLGTGMDHSKVHSLIYDACRLDQIRLTSYALGQKLQVFPEYKSAIVSLSLEELERFNAQKGDTEGLVNRALSIEGIRFAVFVKEDVDRVKMSLRSTGSFSVETWRPPISTGAGITTLQEGLPRGVA